jgi:hypothetical protein
VGAVAQAVRLAASNAEAMSRRMSLILAKGRRMRPLMNAL